MINFKVRIDISIDAECIKDARIKYKELFDKAKELGFKVQLNREFHNHSWMHYNDLN